MRNPAWTILLLLLTLPVADICAQDTIVLKDSRRVSAFVKEITSAEIRYRKPGQAEGPIYVLSASQVAAIIYANGFTEKITEHQIPVTFNTEEMETKLVGHTGYLYFVDGVRVNGRRLNRLILKSDNPDAIEAYRHAVRTDRGGKTSIGIGMPLAIGGFTMFVAGIALTSLGAKDIAVLPIIAGAAGTIIGISSASNGFRQRRDARDEMLRAVELYNAGIRKSFTPSPR